MARAVPTDGIFPGADQVQPFQWDSAPLRGRLVRLGPALETILHRHAYPEPVAWLLAEMTALTTVLAATLKFDGIFTLQAKGEGAVRMLVADLVQNGSAPRALRAYAQMDPDAVAALALPAGQCPPLRQLTGGGYLAFTVDQGEHAERYQGIVGLDGDSLTACVQHYFRQSEQLPTGLVVAARPDPTGWRAAALMMQQMPDPADPARLPTAEGAPGDGREDDWRRAMVLMATCTAEELLDSTLSPHALLYRLFHQEGVRVFDPWPVEHRCRCSRARVATTLRALSDDAVESLKENGQITVSCQFCNQRYVFDSLPPEPDNAGSDPSPG